MKMNEDVLNIIGFVLLLPLAMVLIVIMLIYGQIEYFVREGMRLWKL